MHARAVASGRIKDCEREVRPLSDASTHPGRPDLLYSDLLQC